MSLLPSLRRKEGGREALNRWGFVAARIHRGGTGDNHVARSVAEFEIEPAAISREQAFPFLPLLHRSRIRRVRPYVQVACRSLNERQWKIVRLSTIDLSRQSSFETLLSAAAIRIDLPGLSRIEKWNAIDGFILRACIKFWKYKVFLIIAVMKDSYHYSNLLFKETFLKNRSLRIVISNRCNVVGKKCDRFISCVY